LKLIVTGGAGYIGSHSLIALLQAGHDISVIDDLSNSHPTGLARVKHLSGRRFRSVDANLCDAQAITKEFHQFVPEGVVHFAGLKSVADSITQPLAYYLQNVTTTVNLLQAMDQVGCQKIVFSSSATVYGQPKYLPYDETHPIEPVSPYGRSKRMIEQILQDWTGANKTASAICLRYFNPAGAHPSGQIGEDPKGKPNNLLPYLAQVASGRRPLLTIFGDTYPTRDGTGERDFIHVMDVAQAHLAALERSQSASGFQALNIGTGHSVTVRELVATFSKITGRPIATTVAPQRAGDLACFYADPKLAQTTLGWPAHHGLSAICADAWRWQVQNPMGYSGIQ